MSQHARHVRFNSAPNHRGSETATCPSTRFSPALPVGSLRSTAYNPARQGRDSNMHFRKLYTHTTPAAPASTTTSPSQHGLATQELCDSAGWFNTESPQWQTTPKGTTIVFIAFHPDTTPNFSSGPCTYTDKKSCAHTSTYVKTKELVSFTLPRRCFSQQPLGVFRSTPLRRIRFSCTHTHTHNQVLAQQSARKLPFDSMNVMV